MVQTPLSPVLAMTANIPTFLLSVLILLYLSTFVVFAVVRILTGVSIQHAGYLSLKRISVELGNGVKLEIRKLGLVLHRPTFAQPTWVSIAARDIQVTLDLRAKDEDTEDESLKKHRSTWSRSRPGAVMSEEEKRNRALERLRKLRKAAQKLHRWIKWLHMVDIIVTNTTLTAVDIGYFQIGTVTTMIDTRLKTAERNRLFDHCTELKGEQKPAEWICNVRSVLFYPKKKDPVELLDHCMLNVYGVLEKETEGIKDLAIALKFGRIILPFDELLSCSAKLKALQKEQKRREPPGKDTNISLADVMDEMTLPGSRTERMAEVVMEGKELIQSFLEGVKEVQFAISYLLISKGIDKIRPAGKPLQVMVGMKEFGVDIHRLDQGSPAHRMYFSPGDVAHQALLTAIAISVSLDDGARQDKIVYVPMVTMTSRTTLLSKTIQIVEKSESNRNANILSANMVMTSPSIDLEPRHLPILFALSKSKSSRPSPTAQKTHLISRLLPKATIKFSIQEPVIRIVLPPTGVQNPKPGDIDMLISSSSSISADLEARHDTEGGSKYSLESSFRITSHNLYYHAASGQRHDLLQIDSFDLKTEINASPEVQVIAHAELDTFSLRLVRPEIVEGLKQTVGQFHKNVKPDKLASPTVRPDPVSFLRRVPLWLDHFKVEGSDFSVEVAGVDAEISEYTRGAALQVDTWSVDYKARKGEGRDKERLTPRRRAASRTLNAEDTMDAKKTPIRPKNPTDGRKLAIHLRGMEGYMVDSPESWEQDPFMNLPHFDMSFSTSSDREGPTMNIQSHVRSFYFNYSLYRHYTVIVATKVLREAFLSGALKTDADEELQLQQLKSPTNLRVPETFGGMVFVESPMDGAPEFIAVDFKVQQIQVKATMPDDPPIMFEVSGLDGGRHRWGFPFVRTRNFRMYAESPTAKNCWARLVSTRALRLDMRDNKRTSGGVITDEKSIDLSADAIRLGIPHQLILHKVTDNIINTAKACEQMHHRFKTGTNEYVLEKKAEGPKKVPRITLRTKALLIELEDDPFETELGLIYRIGLSEQKKRLAREAAFDAKVKKMKEMQKSSPTESPRTSVDQPRRTRGRSKTWKAEPQVNRSLSMDRAKEQAKVRSRSALPSARKKAPNTGNMRYDPGSAAGPSENAAVSIDEAWNKLQQHNSTAWIKRMKSAKEYYASRQREAREAFWGPDEMPFETSETERILGLPMRPALMAGFFNDVDLTIDKPSFPLKDLPKFLHRVGKGLPEDTKFALLVPLNIKLEFGEARVLLRDYPLPLIHVPNMRATQSVRVPSWCLQTDFVIAEELRDTESMRHAMVHIVPPTNGPGVRDGGFAIDVRRTVSPVKSYSDIKVDINTDYATRITWCTSYQPAIQDMMMVFETFSKPHVDPSDKTGFWDKIRLILHSEVQLNWAGDGDVHFTLKGSRDPYKITGDGAGLVMCWRGDVRLSIGKSSDPQELLVVESEEYILAIPDFTHHAIDGLENAIIPETKSIMSSNSYKSGALFKKVIMKLSGKVRWMVGIMFEQELSHEEDWMQRKRSFEFKPHYEVTLKSPQYARAPPGEVYDAFRGFRSHHLHLSLAITSPINRDWSSAMSLDSYNTIHMTPRFFTHFYSWWNLFSGAMSLPVRQGALWPGPEKTNKKFGRHLATIKYKLCLSPLFISHIYKHADKDEDGNDVVAATGLKAKLDSFLLDIHQRREETLLNPRSTGMKINQAECDFHSADIRAVSAIIGGVTMEDLVKQAHEPPQNLGENIRVAGDMSQFTIPDGDTSWIDMDDFVELDWVLPSDKTPVTKIMPLAFTPRFTYFRQTDHSDDSWNPSPFGHEPSHTCIMSLNNDPQEIQCELIQARLERVNHQMGKNKEAIDSLAHHMKWKPEDKDLREKSEELIRQSSILFNKRRFLQIMLRKMSTRLHDGKVKDVDVAEPYGRDSIDFDMDGLNGDAELLEIDPAFTDDACDYDNRFIVHNMQAKWNNGLRNIILKYIHQASQRRGFVYYMSRRAVKFILDIIEEQKVSGQTNGVFEATVHGPSSTSQEENDDSTLQSRIQELLDDSVKFVVADEKPVGPHASDQEAAKLARDDLAADVADEYVPKNSYHVRLVAPQIQMQSEKNQGAAVIVAAQGMQLKVVSVMDKERIGDEVSGLVQRRFALNLDNTQFFVSHHQDFAPESMSLHSANRYGAPSGSSWPPWVPLETMFDFQNNPVGFNRVVERTSATLRYDKHNSLRLKYSDQVSGMERGACSTATAGPLDVERRIDQVWVDFPRVEASCDSSQYFAMYIIVLDLLLYAEPLEKLRSEKLEKIMLASDFSDLTGAPEMVERLQSRIHKLEEIKTYFQVNAANLDDEGWKGRVTVDEDLASCEEELFFMMKAITTAQRKHEDRGSQTSSVVRWYLSASEIIWHMLREKQDPFIDIMLQNAGYERVDNADGSHYNTVEVEMMRGFNLLPNAAYPEMISPFFDQHRTVAEIRQTKILRVYWHMLEAIAGIPVMDHFEVNLFPLKIQLEREVAEKLFEYIFPGVGGSAFDGGGFSPFLVHSMKPLPDPADGSDSDDDERRPPMTPTTPSMRTDDSSSVRSDEVSPAELRLQPTLSLSPDNRPKSAHSARPKTSSGASVFSAFGGSSRALSSKASHDSLSLRSKRKSIDDTRSFISVGGNGDRKKAGGLFSRRPSNDKAGHEHKRSDELSQMMSRASNYMTLAYIKIPSVVLCLSYKGRKESNFEDIHEFVFRMPMLEYRNKMWSNLDLAIRLKKDIIRALVSHTGAILQNKLTHHRPNNKNQLNPLRMMASNGSLAMLALDSTSSGSPEGPLSPPLLRPDMSRHTSSASSLAPPSFKRPQSSQRPMTSYSSFSIASGTTFADYPMEGDGSFEDDEDKHGIFHNTLGRHLTHLAQVARHRDGIAGDTEESIKKKSRMLLGKKVFGSGPH